MTTRERILVFVPAYNCERQIVRVLAQLDGPAGQYVDEVIVIDNGSTDDTRAAAQAALDRLALPGRLLGNRENVNLGGSHKVALRYAVRHGFDYLVVLHGDDQADITDFCGVFASGLHRHCDFIMGSRFSRGARRIGYHWTRTFFNMVFNTMFSIIGRRCLADLGSGLNCFRVGWFTERHHWRRFADDLTFNYHLILAIADAGSPVHFYPISWREEDQVSNARLFKHGSRTLGIIGACGHSAQTFLRQEHTPRGWSAYQADVVHANVSASA